MEKPAAIWVQFKQGKIKAHLIKRNETISLIRYAEPVDFTDYKAKRGEERRVWNVFISPRRE
jgi:hypothetical protein